MFSNTVSSLFSFSSRTLIIHVGALNLSSLFLKYILYILVSLCWILSELIYFLSITPSLELFLFLLVANNQARSSFICFWGGLCHSLPKLVPKIKCPYQILSVVFLFTLLRLFSLESFLFSPRCKKLCKNKD